MSRLWNKAKRAARSARALLADGDADGAINRAYYAMFCAARVALAAVDRDLATARSHATIVRRFGKHLVKERGLDVAFGRLLAKIGDTRRAADYEEEEVAANQATEVLDGMDGFLAAVEDFIKRAKP
jgi:uncharacterized protein (UPF0332 family)